MVVGELPEASHLAFQYSADVSVTSPGALGAKPVPSKVHLSNAKRKAPAIVSGRTLDGFFSQRRLVDHKRAQAIVADP